MSDEYLILSSSIRKDLEEIARIFSALGRHRLAPDVDSETLIVVSYYLHNLYNAFENIFLNVGVVFENHVDDSGRWHTQLLERCV